MLCNRVEFHYQACVIILKYIFPVLDAREEYGYEQQPAKMSGGMDGKSVLDPSVRARVLFVLRVVDPRHLCADGIGRAAAHPPAATGHASYGRTRDRLLSVISLSTRGETFVRPRFRFGAFQAFVL